MKGIWNWIKNNPNRAMFLVPMLLVAGISISHVVTWYDMANPINWAIYLSIAIEIGAMTALVAATNKIKGGVWFMFGLVTFIQMIGNIFYSYDQIDATGDLFKNWVELTGPVWEMMGTDLTDTIGLKRWLAFLEGGLLPLISLTSLHFFVNYEKKEEEFEVKMSVPEGKEFNTPYPIPEVEEEETIEESNDIELAEQFDEDHAMDMVMNNMVEEIMEEEGHETIDELLESLNEDEEEHETLGEYIDSLNEDKVEEELKVFKFRDEKGNTQYIASEGDEETVGEYLEKMEEEKVKDAESQIVNLPKET